MRFGVQVKEGEHDLQAIEAVFRKAHALKVTFKALQALEPFTLGVSKFVRVDVGQVDMMPVIEALFADGRGVVHLAGDGFVVRMGSRTGKISLTSMQTSTHAPKMYRGTLDPFWERQFPKK